MGLIPGLERSLGEGNGNPLQYYCLENFLDRGAWQATVHGAAVKTQLKWLSRHKTRAVGNDSILVHSEERDPSGVCVISSVPLTSALWGWGGLKSHLWMCLFIHICLTHHSVTGFWVKTLFQVLEYFALRPVLLLKPQIDSSLRLGTECETFNRHNTAEIMAIKENINSNHIQRYYTHLGFLSWSAIQFRKLKFSVIWECV